jgi:hypothetical protein
MRLIAGNALTPLESTNCVPLVQRDERPSGRQACQSLQSRSAPTTVHRAKRVQVDTQARGCDRRTAPLGEYAAVGARDEYRLGTRLAPRITGHEISQFMASDEAIAAAPRRPLLTRELWEVPLVGLRAMIERQLA